MNQALTDWWQPGPEAVAALSAFHAEPEWMLAARQAAWERYTALPLPTPQEEAWRRTPAQRFPLETLRWRLDTVQLATLDELPIPCQTCIVPENLVGGTLIHLNGSRAYGTLRPELARQGVILEDLHRALQSHGALIRAHWPAEPGADGSKFTALNAALWHGGAFVYVPAGVKVALPLQLLTAYTADAGSGLPRTLIVAEAGSRVTLLHDRFSHERAPELNAETVTLVAGEGAQIRYISLQHWGAHRWTVSTQQATLQRGANLVWLSGALGGETTKEFLRSELVAPEARVLMQGFAFAHGEQRLDQSTYQHHRAPQTTSDLLFRNVLRDVARTVFYGMIRVEPEAQQTEGYQANHSLLLDDAHAHSIPGLEILANDVRCSHGSTLSRPNPEQLFYLQARGLPRSEAERLLVQGFLAPIVDRIPLAYTRERLQLELAQRFQEGR